MSTPSILTVSMSLLCWTIAHCDSPNTDQAGRPAGIIAYHCEGSEAEYLLAFDRIRRGYGAPGGAPKLGETAAQTALREFREETNCVYSTDELSLRHPVDSGDFTSYFSEVAFRSRQEIAASVCESREGAGETTDFRWVGHDLLVADFQGRSSRLLNLWSRARISLKAALADVRYRDPCRYVPS